MASTHNSETSGTQQACCVSTTMESNSARWLTLATAVLGLLAAIVSLDKSCTLQKEVDVLKKERVSFSLMYPQSKEEVGQCVTVRGVATPGSRHKYVFIGTKGDRSNNPNWRSVLRESVFDWCYATIRISSSYNGSFVMKSCPV